jgi:hypothetical protein
MSHQIGPDADDILPKYHFSRGVRGTHHQAYKAGTNVVFLDPDVAQAFGDSASVNQALRLLVKLAQKKITAGGRRNKLRRRTIAPAPKKAARARR